MDWDIVGKKLAKHGLNLLGSAFPGAGIITGVVADMLGCDDDPDSIDKALANATPDKILELKRFQLEHKVDLQKTIMVENTKRITEVNKTIRKESESDKWWVSGWRPFWGFTSALALCGVTFFLCYLGNEAITKGDPNALIMIPQMVTTFTGLFAIPGAILGISAHHRGKEKIEKIKMK